MAFKQGKRNQSNLFPQSIDDYVHEDDPVRAYDIFIDQVDIEKMGISTDSRKVGNSSYDPRLMLKLLVYSYSYGWRSSRKIERALHHNLSFIWLLGGLKPDFKTISEFRRKNKESITKILKQCVRMCIKLDLIEGNTLFVDGTKIRANASRGNNYSESYYHEQLQKIDSRIKELLAECEAVDKNEEGEGSYVRMSKEILQKESLRDRIKEIVKEFKKDTTKKSINKIDPESALMKSVQGSHASYNVQSVVDERNGLIISVDATEKSNDREQFSSQIKKAESTLGKECKVACGDSGYSNTNDLSELDTRGTKVIVPTQRQALHKAEPAFSKSAFTYNKDENCYYCPEGQKLVYHGYSSTDRKLGYRIEKQSICKECNHYGTCTKAQRGRGIRRLLNEEVREKLEQQYASDDGQSIYKKRKNNVEHPFGHIKQNLGLRNFLLRGKKGANAEISLAASCFNIRRMITLLGGVSNFINVVKEMRYLPS